MYDDGYADGTTVQTSTGEVDRGHDGSGPYRGGKYQIYEGGTRIPFVVRWPGRVTPGVTNALVTQVDLVASFAALLGQELPGRAAQDSRDMLDAFLGKDTKGAEIILEHANQLSIRKDHWKYIEPGPRRKKSAAGELFDLANDIGEKQNVLDEHEEVARELSGLLTMYRERGLR